MLSFIDIYTKISNSSNDGRSLWSFIFEDDVNVVHPNRIKGVKWDIPDVSNPKPSNSTYNYTGVLSQIMSHPDVRDTDGMFYLGSCAPQPLDTVEMNITKFPPHDKIHSRYRQSTTIFSLSGTLLTVRASGKCAHAFGLTSRRAHHFWSELSSYPIHSVYMDVYLHEWSVLSHTYPYTVAWNFDWPPNTDHKGLIYQDRATFHSLISE
ncbi:unnamed protein product [Didymodactylos carnosus]|uniref:Uncharacterized protein n=1 Tax=Didymodactylos carnosus TaxID=1234261 RepID=A0A815YYI2_9BILA|nr:unnamed protein product [Didymodactylos carnosus]CAF4443458.1 unnamed protein product [Didymodactylos carnosus]